MDLFIAALCILIVVCITLHVYTREEQQESLDGNFRRLQISYLAVYLLGSAGDWIQGPHVYALYESYGLGKHEIEILFIAGFGSSMIFGTIIASLADKYGRKNICFFYGVVYALSCVTKHFRSFQILFFGRLLAGMATSILFSAFESWLINEHRRKDFPSGTLSTIFANAYLGNSIVAVLSGISAQLTANAISYVAPFDTAIVLFTVMCMLILTNWSENYGDANAPISQSFFSAWNFIRSDRKILLLGIVQALFEASMYVFILEWTPALTNTLKEYSIDKTDSSHPPIPHGYIFASYMVAMMMGSNSFKIFSKYVTPDALLIYIIAISAACLSVPVIKPESKITMFTGFLVFEFCIGVFWPSMATLRSIYVPEEARVTVMNYFRIPLNLIVVIILLKDCPLKLIFTSCVFFLLIATVCMVALHKLLLKSTLPQPQDSINLNSKISEGI